MPHFGLLCNDGVYADHAFARSRLKPMRLGMTQAQLNEIWNAFALGHRVEGWGGHKYNDLDVLTQHDPHQVWARQEPMHPWIELPRMGDAGR
jgi:hypothetical protein